ncbi:MAG: U32 family peptidase [Spirochaetales bacterium]|nr:U32 family peptidase [Spirochaetales bacterium]
MSELLAPGGQFASAFRAFENGADAVYLGLSQFSARKGAVNFSLEDLRRLRGAFPEKSLHLALNTLVSEAQLAQAASLLLRAVDAGIDALIVQDAGIADMAKEMVPHLPLHASTQMAIHDVFGAKDAYDRGFSRVVLARECSLIEIRKIREALPSLELEVFVHGAMCFGFSGLCQASQALLGRSANRGGCGQICRTWFENAQGEKAYTFSQNDLEAAHHILELQSLGVESFKIEGRMKSPEYTGTVCQYYRSLLDGQSLPSTKDLGEEAALRFSRNQSLGWFPGKGKTKNLINPQYPGATGVKAATVLSSEGGWTRIHATRPLLSRDGLLWFQEGALLEPHRNPVVFREKKRHELKAGEKAWIRLDTEPEPGTVLHLLSKSDGKWPEVNASSYPLYKTPLPLILSMKDHALTITAKKGSFCYTQVHGASWEPAQQIGGFHRAAQKAFSSAGPLPYQPQLAVEISVNEPEPFIPPKQLKKFRQEFFERFQQAYEEWTHQQIEAYIKDCQTMFASHSSSPWKGYARDHFIRAEWEGLPFPLSLQSLVPQDLPLVEGMRMLPLPPVNFWSLHTVVDEHPWLREIQRILQDSSEPLAIGLNNPSHLFLAQQLILLDLPQKFVFFLDYGLYVVNSAAWKAYKKRLPQLQFFVRCREAQADGWPPHHDVSVDMSPQFPLPLFIARTCPLRHHSLPGMGSGEGCPADCGGNYEAHLSQNGQEYRIITRQCLTYVLSSSQSSSSRDENVR